MSDQENDRLIRAAAEGLLTVLESPIRGVPSISVRNRANARRLVEAAFRAIWESMQATNQKGQG